MPRKNRDPDHPRITLESVEAAREETRIERAAQGLPPYVEDPAFLMPVLRWLDAPPDAEVENATAEEAEAPEDNRLA